ncbi:MAG: DUF4430 domain-containing protein [Ruminococcus sp.]
MTNKKSLVSVSLAVLMCLAAVFALWGCTSQTEPADSSEAPTAVVTETTAEATESAENAMWADAQYTEDTTVGEGSTKFYFEVVAGDNSVTFTVNTDEEILGDALLKNELVAGDESQYGLYVKTVNGILADYDLNGYYWSFTKNGEMMMTGVDGETIEADAHYEMTLAK